MNFSLPRLALVALSLVSFSLTVWAQTGAAAKFVSTPLSAYPPNIADASGNPMLMLTASRDHTLFAPIYTDYEDVDGDGKVDYTFKPSFRYYGYFDPEKCYGYNKAYSVDGVAGRFEPKAMASTDGLRTCPSTGAFWSGNFLNWATMTRLDVVRKTLYGGHRIEDTADETTLQMASVGHDAHSFVKYYSGTDIRAYTPFSAADLDNAGLTICNRGTEANGQGAPQMRIAKGNYSLWATTPGTVCNWASAANNFAFGVKAQKFYGKYGPPESENPFADKQAHRERLPDKTANGGAYDGGVGPELIVRVQACSKDYDGLGSERCRFYRQTSGETSKVSRKPIGLLQEFGTSELKTQPVRAEFGLITGSYDDNFMGGRLRKNMGSVNDEIDLNTGQFCLKIASTTGSNCAYSSANTTANQAGIIRAFESVRLYNAGQYDDNAPTFGVGGSAIPFPFPSEVPNKFYPSWGNPMSEMITQALAYFAHLPMGGGDGTTRDKEVGMPISVAATDPLADTANDPVAGIPRKDLYGRAICRPMHMLAISSGAVTHDTDEPGDSEDVYGTATAFLKKNVPTESQIGATIQAATDRIGQLEGINSKDRSVGSASAGFGVDCTAKQIGTVVTAGLAQVAGVCPEAPAVKGTYLGAGAAFMAHTRAIRELNELTTDTGRSVATDRLPANALRVRSYGATLSGGVARIEVPIPGKSTFVYITPESSWDFANFGKVTNGALMPGAMLTFRSLYGDARSASYVVTWNDAQFGGDYDMDIVGFLRWELKESLTKPGAFELTVLTDILNHNAGAQGSHGFSIIGTDKTEGKDGRYLTHGGVDFEAAGSECAALKAAGDAENFALRCAFRDEGMGTGGGVYDGYAWPTTLGGQAVDFIGQVGKKTTTVAKTFLVTAGVADVALKDPLWYLAKYGSFDTGESKFALSTSALPDAAQGSKPVNWDSQNNNGDACGATGCADGQPDGYFLARRPELLEERLRKLLMSITQGSNSAPAVSATQLVTGSLKYTAEFFADSFGGTVKAYRYDASTDLFDQKEAWDASAIMTSAGLSRSIVTDNGVTGLVFDWPSLSVSDQVAYRAALMGLPLSEPPSAAQLTALAEGAGTSEKLVNYVRGLNTHQGSLFRVRNNGVMGPIVNSTPWLQSSEVTARFTDADFPDKASYRAFVLETKADATPVLWVGANDGMLHGLNATTGSPIVSYVPSPLVGRLSSALAASNTEAVALMDGSPFTADVLVSPTPGFDDPESSTGSAAWHTYLFSSLGRGGRAVFALDVTDPAGLSTAQTAATKFKWVFSSSVDPDMGYQLLDPVRHQGSGQASSVVHLNSGDFGLLVPNGHGSAQGKAALFILSVNGPSATGVWQPSTASTRGSYRKIMVSQPDDSQNGLMGATWVDLDNNGTADVVYATDLRGQLWKFDLRSSDPREWGSALLSDATPPLAAPLFVATNGTQRLPITTAPVAFSPSFGGTMISFGTGRAIESGDFPDLSVPQRFFTVWDKGRYPGDQINPPLEDGSGNVTVVNQLPRIDAERTVGTGTAAQTVKTFIMRALRRDAAGNVTQVQTTAQGTVETKDGQEVPLGDGVVALGFNPAVNDGWYFDFPSLGEGVISTPVRRLNFIVFTSVRPKSGTERDISCTVDPQGALYAFSPVSGLPIRSLLSTTSLLIGKDLPDQKATIVGKGADSVTTGGNIGGGAVSNKGQQDLNSSASNLRIQWREIMGLRTRPGSTTKEDATKPEGAAE